VQDSLVYDGFGNITYQTPSPSVTPLYFWTGREFDAETALQYNRARYYDPSMGRWISQDPMGFDAGDSNLYRYVRNDPIEMRDSTGLQPERVPSWNWIVGDKYYDLPGGSWNVRKISGIMRGAQRELDSHLPQKVFNETPTPTEAQLASFSKSYKKEALSWGRVNVVGFLSSSFNPKGKTNSVPAICRDVSAYYAKYGIVISWDVRQIPAESDVWRDNVEVANPRMENVWKSYAEYNPMGPLVFFLNTFKDGLYPKARGLTLGRFTWIAATAPDANYRFTLAHELGHSLGLRGHQNTKNNLMAPRTLDPEGTLNPNYPSGLGSAVLDDAQVTKIHQSWMLFPYATQ
jgi:RHS repeat-associated protein